MTSSSWYINYNICDKNFTTRAQFYLDVVGDIAIEVKENFYIFLSLIIINKSPMGKKENLIKVCPTITYSVNCEPHLNAKWQACGRYFLHIAVTDPSIIITKMKVLPPHSILKNIYIIEYFLKISC